MGNVFDQMAGTQPAATQPVAQKPPVDIPQPIQDVRTTAADPMGGPHNQAELDAMTVRPEKNAFDSMAAQAPPTTQVADQSEAAKQAAEGKSDTMDYLKKIWGDTTDKVQQAVGKMVPQAATGPLAAATHYVIEPYNESMAWASKKAGELTEEAAVFGTPYTVEQARKEFPRTMGISSAVGETVGGLVADPRNWPLMGENELAPVFKRLMSGGFALQMGKGAKDKVESLIQNWKDLTPYERWKQGTDTGLGSLMTVAAASHAVMGEKAPAQSQRGTVAGERTKFQPTTQTTAGVEAPISAMQQANPNAFTRMASSLADPGKATEFQNEQTKPAAVKQAVSTLSQVATDKIAAHDALVNGEASPAPITGTQTPGAHATPDDIWSKMQDSANQTWEKARNVSASENEAWERERVAAEKNHQEGIDHYNSLVEAHNADPNNAGNRMEPQSFNPEEVDLRDKPKTFDELKGDVESAKDGLTSDNTADRQKAKDVTVPKAEKALDKWFSDHEDQVSKGEYESAKKLYSDSESFKTISNTLRKKLTLDTLNGNDIRGLEATIDRSAIRRRGAAGIGEYKRLIGPEAYDNLQNVAKLFDPLEKTDPRYQVMKSWGSYVATGVLTHMLGFDMSHVAGVEAAQLGFRKFMNNVLFNPEFGGQFGRLVQATKDAVTKGVQMPKELLSRFSDTLKQLWNRQEGEAEIPGTGTMGNVGKEPKPQFQLNNNGPDEQGDPSHVLAIRNNGEHVGHLNISQKTPDSWTVNDASIRPDMQGKGLGTKAYQEAFKQAAAAGMKFVESDISTTKAAARTWNRLMELHPDAVTEENGQYTADLSKLNGDNTIAKGADAYNAAEGRPPVKHEALQPDARRAEIADAFDQMKHDPNDPEVAKSYAALKSEVKKQWDFAQQKLGIKIEPTDQDPYGFSGSGKPAEDELFDDVNKNKHLGVWRGGNPLGEGHPLAEVDPETGENYNTMLRAVHDLFGHVAAKNKFGEAGEESAWNLHKQMFSPEAMPAMTTETRGQTSWFFNHEGVRGGEAPGRFAEQKAGLLPEFANIRSADFDKLAAATKEHGGFTFNPNKGDMTGKPAFAVAGSYPKLSEVVDGTPSAERLKEYASNPKVQEVLKKNPDASIGAWQSDGKTHLEISETPTDREQAIALGKKNNQESIWDLSKGKEIPTGGTGTNAAPEDTGFNPDELDKENEQDQQAYRQSLAAHEIATRQPSQDRIDKATGLKSTITPPNDPSRLSGLASLDEANNTTSGRGNATRLSMKQKLVAAFADYKQNGLKITQEDIDNPDAAIGKIVNHIQDNYQWVYDQMPESIRKVAQQWYETVHNSTKAEAERTGLSHPQVAGVVAAFSPQNPWDNNRESAYKLIDLAQNAQHHEWTPQMDTALQGIKDVNTTVKPGAPGLTNGQIAFGKLADAIRGKKFNDFNAEPDKEVRQGLQALWLRTLDEAHTEDRSIPVMTPNGEITGHAGTRAWPSIDVMARGLDIIQNGKDNLELINEHLGGGNKVRNFYNNMINPWSERGHFTADTHQVGAGLLQALSSKSTEAMHNFGSGNQKGIASPGKNSPTGVKGTYPVYQEAGVRAAAENGVRPNQFQSMTWEGIRSLLGDDKKTPALEQAIRSIWEQHENGDISINQARKQILEASGGFTKPEWMSQADWDADPSPNKAETVLANRPPERTPEAIVDAAKTRKVREQMEEKAKKNAEKATKQAEQKAKSGGAKPAGKRGI